MALHRLDLDVPYSFKSPELNVMVHALSKAQISPLIHGFWLGNVRTVTVGTTLSIHFLMKPVTELVKSLMLLSAAALNMSQSAQSKQLWSKESDCSLER